MKSVHDQIRDHIYEVSGVISREKKDSYENIIKTEWSPLFERLMRNRLIMGYLRYGSIKRSNKKYNRIDSIRQRIDLYEETGNGEHLVDVANLCLCEFERPNHNNFHFHATDDKHHQSEKGDPE